MARRVDAEARTREVIAELEKLPAGDREVLEMSAWSDLSQVQIPQLDPLRLQARKHALLNEISVKPSRRWWRFTVPATALIAAVAVTLVLWTPTNQDAAAWSAEPKAPSDLGPMITACTKTLDRHDAERGVDGQPVWPAPREAAVTDQRGDMTMVVFTGPQSEALCYGTPPAVGMNAHGGFEEREPLGDRPFADFAPQIGVPDVNSGTRTTILTGRVSPQVGKAVIVTEDGLDVTASLGNGWVVTWWPSLGKPTEVRLYDVAGTLLQTAPIPVQRR
ncbi:hypothetical protein [Lentzea sp. NBRC 102530]|uniref:hypothetical protein n=1 Tax=Lentzea sp. NBRC 102530 TaxID=3032201 RepID=UPI0024A1E9D2|nr:hypothetical protein [Lentzea sp. NBRC 102530]GLY49037.1 hypothetical protein Lesp01_26930 [Lentzea sp. NBRC 102530]